MMGLVFLSLFVANLAIGWLGGLFEHMTSTAFWGLQAAVAAAGGILAALLRRRAQRLIGAFEA
jgi:proton-dependent oligopeptide transporter, POT family